MSLGNCNENNKQLQYYTIIRMPNIQNTDSTQGCQGGGASGTLTHCSWVWKTVQSFGRYFVVPYKTKDILTRWPSNHAPWIENCTQNELKTYVHTKIYTHLFIAALSIIAKTWKSTGCPAGGDG